MDEPKRRGRPPGSKNKRKPGRPPKPKNAPKTLRKRAPHKVCATCGEELHINEFYKSRSPMHKDGYSPYCKSCIAKQCEDENKQLSVDQLKMTLQMLNRPFVYSAFQGAMKEFNEMRKPLLADGETDVGMIVGRYFKTINSLPQYSEMTWNEGVEAENIRAAKDYVEPEIVECSEDDQPIWLDDEVDFTLTRDTVEKYGNGYSLREYAAMVKKYNFLSASYPNLTNLHEEALITYVRYKVKEEFAVAAGDVEEAEKWGALAAKQADKARINPSQLTQSDLQGGLNSFTELMMKIEQAKDILDILPKFRFRPQDAVDFTIWQYVNYIRKTEGKPECSYEDVYHFYDERKAEYIAQYGDPTGIFTGDPTESNRKQVKKFITLPKEFGDVDG